MTPQELQSALAGTKKGGIAAIKALLMESDKAVERAVLAIYARQTQSEQDTASTREHNCVGFNGLDAELLSSFAVRLQSGRNLTPGQMPWARKKIVKYAGQLLEITKEKQALSH
jgi:hypothetical protein